MGRIGPTVSAVVMPLLAAGLAMPAYAQPADAGPARAAAAVPSCVLTEVDDGGASDYVIITNACRRTVRVQVRLANYPDSDCVSVPETESRSVDWWYPGRYDGLKTC